MRTLSIVLAACFAALPLSAQLPSPGESGVTMGHLHIRTPDVETHVRFWTEGMGAVPMKLGAMDLMKFPDAFVLIQKAESSGGTDDSVVHHLAFHVRDLKSAVDRALAAGARLLPPPSTPGQAFVMAPGEIRIEFTGDPSLAAPVAHHHIHFYTTAVEDMRGWYVKMFGATPGRRGRFEAADLPGANLSFSPSKTPRAPTRGRVLDHIGFEVQGLEAFCRKLEAMGVKFDIPYRTVPALGVSIAFLTDPWGTYIELTEGLSRL